MKKTIAKWLAIAGYLILLILLSVWGGIAHAFKKDSTDDE
jgi:hypothetical protein